MPLSSQVSHKASHCYDFAPGAVLARKYEVLARVGASHGELYMLAERATGIERTGKFFDPREDPNNRAARSAALKLHRLRHCDILVHYRTQETISIDGRDVTFLVSDFVKGKVLRDFLAGQPRGRLSAFEGLHLLHALALGLEKIHAAGEYHGELEMDNLFVRRRGLGFQTRLVDVSADRLPRLHGVQSDVFAMIRLFHEAIGGTRAYPRQPAPVKAICCGLRRPLIAEKFSDAGALRRYLETMAWS